VLLNKVKVPLSIRVPHLGQGHTNLDKTKGNNPLGKGIARQGHEV
jgi:hypothetical protein